MNIAAGRNRYFARQGRASTNAEASRTRELFKQDQALSDYYNKQLAGGKWNHLMDQPHLGQFTWEPPRINSMPAVSEVLPADTDNYGVAIEGDVSAWPDHFGDAVLPPSSPSTGSAPMSRSSRRGLGRSVLDRGRQTLDRAHEDTAPRLDRRFWVEIDWEKAPTGASAGTISVKGKRGTVNVKVLATKASEEQAREARGRFASLVGPIAIAAPTAARNVEVGGVRWGEIPDYGRGASAMSIFPVTAESVQPPDPAPRLEYPVFPAARGLIRGDARPGSRDGLRAQPWHAHRPGV